MIKRLSTLKVLSFVLIFIFPCASFSASDIGETVIKRGTVNDDYYVASDSVNIDAEVAGDAVVAGGDLFIGRRIQGDIMAVGGSVNIRGEILDDVRVIGGDVNIDATIGDDLAVAGGEIKVFSTTSTGGEAWLAGGDVDMAGTINKGLSIVAGTIRISGTVRGDVVLEGGEIHILEGALIEGSLRYKSANKATIHPDAKIIGDISYEEKKWDHPHRAYGIFFSITMIAAAIVLFLLFPGFTLSSVEKISSDPWKNLGVGFALVILTPVAAILLMSVVLGIWIGLSILALYFVALLLGFLISCFFLGDWGARRLRKNITTTGRRLFSVALGIIFVGIIQLIPVIGGLFIFVLLLSGLGAVASQLHCVYRQSDKA